MKISQGIEIPDSLPALFLSRHKALVIADLHIGYEAALREKGIHMPDSSYPLIKRTIDCLLKSTGATQIIILGDLKHEFGKPSAQEWIEVMDLLEYLSVSKKEVHVVRGNHDNLINRILSRYDVTLHERSMLMGTIFLAHGDKVFTVPERVRTIITAHEHPAVISRDKSGSRYKFKCFLIGKIGKKRLIVMPALSPLSSGVGINEAEREALLSPLLRETDIDSFVPIVVEEDVGIFKFPSIGAMRQLNSQAERLLR
ncbi:MAG: metallophosphoesterase [Candidatus Methanomethylicia archaeon]|nr:metallophosphoesterase [Candidatus Methanomethylicia archaeon]